MIQLKESTTNNIHLDGKIFKSVLNTDNGEVSGDTRFHYHQNGNVVTAEYLGGSVAQGHLIATISKDGCLNMRYHHVNKDGELMLGQCLSTPEILPDGRIRYYETWQWLSGDNSKGESIIEEIFE
jgi:hypothetical protein